MWNELWWDLIIVIDGIYAFGYVFGIFRVKLLGQAGQIDCCQTSNISHTKFQNLIVSHCVLQLSLPNPLKPGVKSRMRMQLELLQLHLNDQQFYCKLMCVYIIGLRVDFAKKIFKWIILLEKC